MMHYYIRKIIGQVLGLAVLGVVLSLSSCGCSGDDSSNALPIFQFNIFDDNINVFAFNGIYEPDELKIYLSDGTTSAHFFEPSTTGLIELVINFSDAVANSEIWTSVFFLEFGEDLYELQIDYTKTTTGRCDLTKLELESYTFDGHTTVPEYKIWGNIIDLFLQ